MIKQGGNNINDSKIKRIERRSRPAQTISPMPFANFMSLNNVKKEKPKIVVEPPKASSIPIRRNLREKKPSQIPVRVGGSLFLNIFDKESTKNIPKVNFLFLYRENLRGCLLR